MIQTKQVFKYVLHWNIIIVFLHFDVLGPCVYIKLKKYVTGPWIPWNLVYIFLTYMFVCLFVWFDSLRPLNNLSVMRDGSSWVEPVLS